MLRTPLGACNDNRGTDCRSRLHGFAMTRKEENGLPRTLRRSRLPARSVLLLHRGVHRTPAPQWQNYKRFSRLRYLLAHTVLLYSKGFQREVCPFGHSGRSGNPIERVSGGSFPYFCPYRNRVPARHERKIILKILLYFISTNKRPVILSAWRERIRILLQKNFFTFGIRFYFICNSKQVINACSIIFCKPN